MQQRLFIHLIPLLVLIFLVAANSSAQELTMYTIPAPKEMNWRSPKKLLISYISNSLYRSPYGKEKHPIGHMLVELKDNSRYALAGVAANGNTGMTNDVIKKGYGLGILFTIINGKMEEAEKNLHQVQQRIQTGDIAFIKYRISQAVFDRLWQYLQEYKEKGYAKFYNGCNKPREGLGAGCSAFVQSFLEVGGLANILPSNEWTIQVSVPEKLIGGPVANNRRVQILKVFFANHWCNTKKQSGRHLFLYDPTKLYKWISKKYKAITDTDTMYKNKLGMAYGFTINCSNILPPDEPIWIFDVLITK